MVSWIWIGGGIMALGTLIAVLPARVLHALAGREPS
jgi:cytochrome c biogenesis factor